MDASDKSIRESHEWENAPLKRQIFTGPISVIQYVGPNRIRNFRGHAETNGNLHAHCYPFSIHSARLKQPLHNRLFCRTREFLPVRSHGSSGTHSPVHADYQLDKYNSSNAFISEISRIERSRLTRWDWFRRAIS